MNTRMIFLLSFLFVSLTASMAMALPSLETVGDTDDDATITLTSFTAAINNDARSRCTVRIVVVGEEVEFVGGDSVVIRIREDDFIGDEIIFQTDFTVTSAEVAAQRVDRTIDCSANFETDGVGNLEVYAEADVDKDECGTFCLNDTPETSNINVEEVEDDDSEEDDTQSDANNIGLGLTDGRANRDQDWHSFSFNQGNSNVRFSLIHASDYGRLEVALFDENERRLADGQDNENETLLLAENLPNGTYFLRVSPQQSNDFNFYDFNLFIEEAQTECDPGERETAPCGNCGTTTRVCDNNGEFGNFGACSDEGECSPGDTRSTVCGNCGTQTEVCDNACGFSTQGQCVGEGECARGDVESMVCDGDAGTQTRTCSDVCQWGDFGDCTGDECEDNEEQECYEGPMGTQGVGVCRVGRQFCANGRFGACQGQISPGPEQCTDGRDNDCDGSSDGADEDCVQEGAEIGSACEQDGECVGELICLQSPQHPEFTGGYCGKDECASAQDCGVDGVCGQFDGQSYCLRLCQSGSDCRRGYRCGNVGAVGNACVPGCNSDADCTDSVLSVCDTNTNQCVEAMDPTPDPTPSPTPDMQPDMTPTPSPTMQPPNNDNFVGDPAPVAGADDGGCCTIPPARPTRTPWAPIALVIVLGLAAAIRRR